MRERVCKADTHSYQVLIQILILSATLGIYLTIFGIEMKRELQLVEA